MNTTKTAISILSGILLLSLSTANAAAQTHVIVHGDTLWTISNNYFGDPLKYTLLLECNPDIKDTHRLRK